MNSEEIAHLAGVLDAAGRVTVHVHKNDGYRLGYELVPVIRITINTNDELLLGKLYAYADENGVHVKEYERKNASSTVLGVRDRRSIERFLEPMVDYLVTNFEAAMLLLEEILPRIEAGEHLERESFMQLVELVEPIRLPARNKQSYDLAYFEDLWSEDATAD